MIQTETHLDKLRLIFHLLDRFEVALKVAFLERKDLLFFPHLLPIFLVCVDEGRSLLRQFLLPFFCVGQRHL
jgi:hypothetical protein